MGKRLPAQDEESYVKCIEKGNSRPFVCPSPLIARHQPCPLPLPSPPLLPLLHLLFIKIHPHFSFSVCWHSKEHNKVTYLSLFLTFPATCVLFISFHLHPFPSPYTVMSSFSFPELTAFIRESIKVLHPPFPNVLRHFYLLQISPPYPLLCLPVT